MAACDCSVCVVYGCVCCMQVLQWLPVVHKKDVAPVVKEFQEVTTTYQILYGNFE